MAAGGWWCTAGRKAKKGRGSIVSLAEGGGVTASGKKRRVMTAKEKRARKRERRNRKRQRARRKLVRLCFCHVRALCVVVQHARVWCLTW